MRPSARRPTPFTRIRLRLPATPARLRATSMVSGPRSPAGSPGSGWTTPSIRARSVPQRMISASAEVRCERPQASRTIASNGESGITVSANAEIGDHVGQVEAAVEGDGTSIAFNAKYLADVLEKVDAEQFALELQGPLAPGVFKPVGDDLYTHVVMPVRTTS